MMNGKLPESIKKNFPNITKKFQEKVTQAKNFNNHPGKIAFEKVNLKLGDEAVIIKESGKPNPDIQQ